VTSWAPKVAPTYGDLKPLDVAVWETLSRVLITKTPRPVCVAFSGGSDSLALLRLAHGWACRAGRPITALTVDHGLNRQSAEWTAAAGAVAEQLGVAWRGLLWRGDKPSQGLVAAARIARHALLAEAAREVGAHVILMGHTADDIAESALIRAETPGHGYLRPWSPSPVWPQGRGVFLVRPLLDVRRLDLRAWLSAQGLVWLEDPANSDPRFARSRARAELSARSMTPGVRRREHRFATSQADLGVQSLARHVEATAAGALCISREALTAAPLEVARRLTSAAVVCAGGGDRPPRGKRLDRLLGALAAGVDGASTLAGARIVSSSANDLIWFGRDVGERTRGGLSRLRLMPGDVAVFDGRFEIEATANPIEIAPLEGLIARLDGVDRVALRYVPAWGRGALPAVIHAGDAVRLPTPLGGGSAIARSLVGDRFAAACGLVGREGL
jgi:tRNA(Ile)-lysidine synthase